MVARCPAMGRRQRLRRAFRHRLVGAETDRPDARRALWRSAAERPLRPRARRATAASRSPITISACRSTPPSIARILARIETEPFPELARRFAVAGPETAGRPKRSWPARRGSRHRAQIDAGRRGDRRRQAALHDLHEAQVWRAAYWRAAREGLTYRRFFEIADLVGVRVERPRVFDDVHRLLLELVAEGQVQGVRLDHIDGLADPKSYLERLQAALGGDEPVLSCSSRKSSARARRCGPPGRSREPPATNSSRRSPGSSSIRRTRRR